jgi:DNA-binding response OmpR family regulator
VPEDSPAPASENPARGILLVESYDALRIALSSALRKFAPNHAIRVTSTLADAEVALETIRPELFVLDLDPAAGGEIAFFDRLRKHHPGTRVLVLVSGLSPELREALGPAGAIHFIEKPFDLGEFGAAVQALLGPWATPSSGVLRGTMRDLRILDVALLKCLSHSSSVVHLQTPQGELGEIHFRRGEIYHAVAGELSGRPALEEIMRWPTGELSERDEEGEEEETPVTIDQPWPVLLLEIMQKWERKTPHLPEAEPTESSDDEEPTKLILVIDDTEMLLIFVADVLGTADRSYQVFTASTGAEGLRLAIEKKPDLVLLDYSLTDMNGDNVCRGLLAHENTATTPVLMMSGHLPEMAHTAETCGNVVATLPKPFLSAALIGAVEKILATPRPASPLASTPRPPAEPPPENHVLPALPNGHDRDAHGDLSAGPAPTAPPPEAPPTPSAPLVMTPPQAAAPPPAPAPLPEPENPPAGSVATEQREVTAIISCEVVSVQLAPDFRMGAMQLKPAEGIVTVRMDASGGSIALPPDKDFRMAVVQLSAERTIATLRVIPAARGLHQTPSGGDFAVDRVSAEPTTAGRQMQLTGMQGAAMRVQLIAPFQLLTVELSVDFEVAAIVLQSHSNGVRVQTGDSSAVAMQFYVHNVQLDDAGRLASLTVGSRRQGVTR